MNCVTVNVEILTRGQIQRGPILFCDADHASSYKRPVGSLVKFEVLVSPGDGHEWWQIKADVCMVGANRFNVTEVWPDGKTYVLPTRYSVSRETLIEELEREGYGEITWTI
jgi:hypothetical protein